MKINSNDKKIKENDIKKNYNNGNKRGKKTKNKNYQKRNTQNNNGNFIQIEKFQQSRKVI